MKTIEIKPDRINQVCKKELMTASGENHLSSAIHCASRLKIPYGFPNASYLASLAVTLNQQKSAVDDMATWLSQSVNDLKSVIETTESEINKLSVNDIDVRTEIVNKLY